MVTRKCRANGFLALSRTDSETLSPMNVVANNRAKIGKPSKLLQVYLHSYKSQVPVTAGAFGVGWVKVKFKNKKRAHSVVRLDVPGWDGNGTQENRERNTKTR